MATENITSTSAPWSAQQPYLQNLFSRADNLYGQGGPQYYPQSTVAPFGGNTLYALDMYNGLATNPNPTVSSSQTQIADTLSGKYLSPDSNPYLKGMYDNAASDVTRHYSEAVAPSIQAQFANSGRAGSGLYANAMDSSRDTLSRNLGGMASNLYGGAYDAERNRQMQGLSLAPSLANLRYLDASQLMNIGNLQDAKAQENLTDQFNRYMYGQERPYDNLARYQSFIGAGNYGSQNTTPYQTPSTAQNVLGGALAGYGLGDALGGYGLLGAGLGGLGGLFF